MENYISTSNQTVFPVSKWFRPLYITTVEMQQKAETVLNVLNNDSDPESEMLTINPTKSERNLIIRINTNQTITIKPRGSFVGETSFTYDITDSHENVISQAVVFVTII